MPGSSPRARPSSGSWPSPTSMAAAAGRLADEIGGAASFADPLDAIGAPGVDAVLIAVSSVHHRAIVEAAAAAGCDILCEKPLALDLAETDAILAAAERAGVRLQVGLMRRHDPDHVRAPGQDRGRRAGPTAHLLQPPVRHRSAPGRHPRPVGEWRDHARHGHPRVRFGPVPDGLRGGRRPGDRLGAGLSRGGRERRRRHGRGQPPVRLGRDRERRAQPADRLRRGRPDGGPRHRRECLHRRACRSSTGRASVAPAASSGMPRGHPLPRFAAAYTDQARAFARSIQDDRPVSPSGLDGRAAFVIAMAAQHALVGGGRIAVDAEA